MSVVSKPHPDPLTSYAASYHGCHICLCPASPKIAVTFLVESYKSVLERRSYVSCINSIRHFVSCKSSSTGLWTILRVVYDIQCGFIKPAIALNLGVLVLPMIVHQAPRCFYLRCCQVFLGLLTVPLLRAGGSQPFRSGKMTASIILDLISFR